MEYQSLDATSTLRMYILRIKPNPLNFPMDKLNLLDAPRISLCTIHLTNFNALF